MLDMQQYMLEKLLTLAQQNSILEIIKAQCARYQEFENQYETLFYTPYTQMRHKYSATSAVISGFAPERLHIDGIASRNLNYGLNDMLVQPELSCEMGIFHIYSDGSDLKGKKIKERCREMNGDFSSPPLFFLLIVSVGKTGKLGKVELCLPDSGGVIVKRKTIYEGLENAVA